MAQGPRYKRHRHCCYFKWPTLCRRSPRPLFATQEGSLLACQDLFYYPSYVKPTACKLGGITVDYVLGVQFLFLFCRLLLAERLSSASSGPLDGSANILSHLTLTSTIGLVVSLVLNTISRENPTARTSSPLLAPDGRASPNDAVLDDKAPHSSSIRPNSLSRIRRVLPGTALPLFLKCLFYLTVCSNTTGVRRVADGMAYRSRVCTPELGPENWLSCPVWSQHPLH